MKPTIIAAALIAAGITSAGLYARRDPTGAQISSTRVSRGDIVATVAATGTLEAVTTVQVGSQLSGTVQALYADFNSIVRKGQVIARLEPSLYVSQVEQSRANLVRAEAEVERLAIALDDATTKLGRTRELSERLLIAAVDLEAAEVQVRSAEAQKRSAEAQVVQARASLGQAELNLEKTIITAPIDGFVVARNVDVGQTVAASLQAPTLYVIAANLTQMRVNAGIDESDVGRVQPGQPVRFRVDAYPGEEFVGTVSQVRLSPIVQQNVVTYAGVIDVPNHELKLKPGMTATVDIETARRDDVLRIPSAALRFNPTTSMLAALGQSGPVENTAEGRRRSSNDTGRLWIDGKDGKLVPRDVQIGFSNSTFTELLDTDLPEGTEIATNISLPDQKTPASTTSSPLFMLQPGTGRAAGPRR